MPNKESVSTVPSARMDGVVFMSPVPIVSQFDRLTIIHRSVPVGSPCTERRTKCPDISIA